MEWYCGKCPKNKEKCDFCKTILGDKAEKYANGENIGAYEPESVINLYSNRREITDFLENNRLGAEKILQQYPDEDMRNAEIYEAHYQVGKESFEEGKFELSMNFFQNILDYKDSNDYYKKTKSSLEIQNLDINEQKYNKAMDLYEKAEIKLARELFYELGDFLDSKQRYENLDKIYSNSVHTMLAIFGALFFLIIIVLIVF